MTLTYPQELERLYTIYSQLTLRQTHTEGGRQTERETHRDTEGERRTSKVTQHMCTVDIYIFVSSLTCAMSMFAQCGMPRVPFCALQ
ncbi:hypothetical protein KGM_213990 [Danaus plexippus plexippus]|uniref:Uncharacterized protein n=1 Tax=Danaus plexippus plexippus TaxID=278856 RepID=A0A212F2L1_DANPL|nr:hypothetical protein KGM_213990 [Danaus plexippus plexippus]